MRSLLLLLCTLSGMIADAQTTDSIPFPPLKIQEWRQHLPWQRSRYVTQSASKVYFATEWAILEVEKSDRSSRFITKVEGLSDAGIRLMRYNAATKTIIIAYNNSNIDLYHTEDESVVNLPFIKTNANLIGDKRVYNVFFDGEFAYLACGFGIVKLNLKKSEAEFTVFTNRVVRSFSIYKNHYYAGTEDGLYRLPVNNPTPEDFGGWEALDAASGFPESAVNALAVWQDALYFGAERTLYRFDENQLDPIAVNADKNLAYLTTEGPGLMIGWKKSDGSGTVEYIRTDGQRAEIHYACNAVYPNYGIEDGENKFWFADETEDFKFYNGITGVCERLTYASPYLHGVSEIAVEGGTVYVATPGANSGLNPNFAPFGVYIYKDGAWSRFYGETNPELKDASCQYSMWRVTPHPDDEKTFYVGSFIGGLIETKDAGATTKCYTKDNSILQNAGAAGAGRTAVAGMAFDEDKNLWICNYSAIAPVAVLKNDGTMRNFSAAPANNLLQVAVDQNGYKWFVVGFNGGVMVYDSGEDLNSPSDDRWKIFTTSNSVLPTNTVNCLAVDLDGDVWVGTQQGVVTFECGSGVFDNGCTGRRRIVNVDDFNGYLLETEDVRTIAVDGANRKWFGTNNGVFVQSPDGLEQIAVLTETNSPLFDNAVSDIAVDQQTGEVWIGTERGLQSIRGEAVSGGKINSLEPYAYPNPVQPGYDGPIAVYGLARDANVKITDIAGNLVYEGRALGGQAVWDGRDYTGRRAASGVYLVFATSNATFDNPDAIIAKLVILN